MANTGRKWRVKIHLTGSLRALPLFDIAEEIDLPWRRVYREEFGKCESRNLRFSDIQQTFDVGKVIK